MLDAQSTPQDVVNEYRACADYDVTQDVPKAKRFVVACRFMLDPFLLQEGHRHGAEETTLDLRRIERQMDEALAFVAAVDETFQQDSDEVIYTSLEHYRD